MPTSRLENVDRDLRQENAELRRRLADAEAALCACQGHGESPLVQGARGGSISVDAAASAQARLAAILESSSDAIYLHGFDGRVVSWNRGAEELYGYPAAEVLGRRIDMLVPPEREDETELIIAAARSGEPVRNRQTVRMRRDGSRFDALLNASPLRDVAGNPFALSIIVRDISERTRIERHLEFLAELGTTFAALVDPDEIVRVAAEQIHAHLGLNRVNLSDVDTVNNSITVFAGKRDPGLADDRISHQLSGYMSDTIVCELAAGRCVVVDDVRTNPHTAPHAAAYEPWQIGSLVLAPHVSDGRWKFLLVAHKATPYAWRPEEVEVLQELTAHVHVRLERARAEQALRIHEALLAGIVESTPDLVWAKDLAGRITFGNRATFDFLGGGDAGRVLGRGARELVPDPAEAQRVLDNDARVVASERPALVDEELSCHGETVMFQTVKAPLRDGNGTVVGVVGVSRDITARKRAEDALKEADRRKDEFLAMLAHELRNPLAPVRTAIAILRTLGSPDPRLGRCHDIIERQVAQMARLLDDLLDVSRLSRGKLTLQRSRVVLRDVLEAAIETSRPLIDHQGHRLTVAPVDPNIVLDGDAARLTQVFANLLNNAAKYCHPGGCIDITVRREPGTVVVGVRDTGIGIAPKLLERVFDLFVQGREAREHAAGGLGIGLSLARRLVEMHDGTIAVTSEGPGRGSEFSVTLPLAAEARAADGAPGEAAAVRPLARRRVLVADDNVDAADTMALLLEAIGLEVHTVYDGEAAVREAERLRPDVLLLDLGMPGLDGHEACSRIRRQPWGESMLIIAITGWGQDEDRRRSAAVGFDVHLVKPVDPERLVRVLQAVRRPASGGA